MSTLQHALESAYRPLQPSWTGPASRDRAVLSVVDTDTVWSTITDGLTDALELELGPEVRWELAEENWTGGYSRRWSAPYRRQIIMDRF